MTEQIRKKTILVIDDAPENIDLFHHSLSGEYKVLAALNGEDALDMLQDGVEPDLVLTDINMPGMSGYEICEHIRSNAGTQHTPVIFVSGMITEKERSEGIEAGGNDFISKPFSLRGIREKINALLN